MTKDTPESLLEWLVRIKRAADSKDALWSQQGQGMDGFSELANYRSIAERAEKLLNGEAM